MKKYIQYIFLAFIAGLMSVSCIQELELETPVAENDVVTLVPRVQSFANQYVTKAEGNNETDIKTLNVLIFNEAGNLVYSKSHTGELSSVTLNKSMLNLTNATIVMIANVDLSTVKYDTSSLSTAVTAKSVTLSDMENYVCHFSDALLTEVPVSGLPMIGGTKVTADQANDSALAISLKILYSKVSFNISVENGSENYGTGMEFTLSGATITNLAGATPLAVPTEEGKPVCDFLGNPVLTETGKETNADADGYTDSGYIVKKTDGNAQSLTITGASGNTKVGATTPLSFTFYIPENRYNHGGLTGIYPDASWTNSTTSSLYDSYKQHYKPALAAKSGGAGMPSYVTLTGTYVDYRGTSWDVNYTVYLGKDNYQNFHVDRNSEYTNYITIKGIRNNDSYTDAGSVWMDHRVEASLAANQGADDCITITRETLIDSHIEVRPLRINMGTKYDAALIYLPKYPLDNQGKIINDPNIQPSSWGQIAEKQGGTNENWIAIENNNGSKIKGKLYCLNGKRKYFTTSLIEELHLENDAEGIGIQTDTDGNRYIALSNGDCAWIYFDENLTSNKRKARIDVVFYRTSDNTRITESYDICQAGLKSIGGYFIEEYEEYLHSYDSDDNYNLLTSPTDYTQTGLPWGMLMVNESGQLYGYKLSDSHVVKSVREGYDLLSERYDYYHSNDGSYYIFQKNDDASWSQVDKSTNTGLKFTARASKKDNMTIIDMGTRPTSAYQYCLSKNKFNESLGDDKHSMMIHWYLPDVYEMKDILNATDADETLKDFAQGAYYWSSQPSFTASLLQVVDEIDDYARAVSLSEDEIKDIYRNEPHRIRCVRSIQGEYADMAERVPDGLGGLIRIPMTVKDNGFFNHNEWFTSLGKIETPYPSTIPNYRFPKGDTDSGSRTEADKDFGGQLIGTTHYYSKNPLAIENWGKIDASSIRLGVYYSMIHDNKWPGLTNKNTTPLAGDILEAVAAVFRVDALAILETTDKTLERSETIRYGNKISAMPADVSSVPLDHNEGSSNLSIAFSSGTNKSKSPEYQYYHENVSSATKRVWHKYWNVPTYNTKTFPPQDPLNYPAPPQSVTFDRDDVLDEIDDVINGFLNELANKKAELVGDPIITPVTTSSIYSYSRSSDAQTAGTNYFNRTINASNEYTLISVDTSPQTVTLCNYSYTYQKYKRNSWFSAWKPDGNPITATGSLTEQFYTYVINYKNIEGTFYRYQSGTGGWATEVELPSESVTITAAQANVDALTLYGANTFTITAKSGYNIKSIKVNYSGSNFITSYGLGGLTYSRYLRLVDANKSLPDRNEQPSNMTYSPDGDKGWFKWSSSGDDVVSSVTLKLVAYSATSSVNVIGQTIPSTFDYTSPDEIQIGDKGLDTSLIIDSFEIRLEEVEQ